MKILVASAMVFAGVMVSAAGAADAATIAQCQQYAANYAEQQYPTGGGNQQAVTTGIVGALVGAGIAGATKGNVGAGAAVGLGVGAVAGGADFQAKKQAAYNAAYNQCIGGSQPAALYAPPVVTPQYLPPGPFNAVIWNTTSLNIRSGPGTVYAVIGSIGPNQPFGVQGCSGGWCFLGTGYVSSAYITAVGG